MSILPPPTPTYYVGTGAPPKTMGGLTDSYLDTDSQFLYIKKDSGWVLDGLATPLPTVGGIQIGTTGAANTIYAGHVLSVGDDFNGTMPDIVSHLNPNGAHFTTRGYVEPGRGAEAPRGSNGLAGYDSDPFYTGNNDANRGIPLPSYANLITQNNSVLSLLSRQTQAGTNEFLYSPAGQIQLNGMIHTAGSPGRSS